METMKRSTNRILTTHNGSLPRPADLRDMIVAKQAGKAVDPEAFAIAERRAVAEAVRHQADVGIDVINDGEQGRWSYGRYIMDRLTGFGEAEDTGPQLRMGEEV